MLRRAELQHGVISLAQLRDVGLSPGAVEHQVRNGWLHPVHQCVFAVGRPHIGYRGRLMAAALACGRRAAVSHGSAGSLWGILPPAPDAPVIVSVRNPRNPCHRGVIVLRTLRLPGSDVTRVDAIPVTTPLRTLIDLARKLSSSRLERAVNEADRLDLIDPETLRAEIARRPGQHGVPALRALLDGPTFTLTDSELERRFLRLVRRAGLPEPQTGVQLNGFKVDFFWPELGLVVETDGLRYHRTAAQQARDRLRDQKHAAAGLIPLRFTHAQITQEAHRVTSTIHSVMETRRTARI